MPRRPLSTVAVAVMLVGGAQGCDPCFGVAGCPTPRLTAQGNVIIHLTGAPAAGMRIELIRLSGPELPSDTLVTFADSVGDFRFDYPAEAVGAVEGVLKFYPPSPYEHFPYAVEINVMTSGRGEVKSLGRYGVGPLPGEPHVTYVGELTYQATGLPAANVEVRFVRTGGVSATPDTLTTFSTEGGYFAIKLQAAGPGTVTGDLSIRPSPEYLPILVPGLSLEVLLGKDDFRWIGEWSIESTG